MRDAYSECAVTTLTRLFLSFSLSLSQMYSSVLNLPSRGSRFYSIMSSRWARFQTAFIVYHMIRIMVLSMRIGLRRNTNCLKMLVQNLIVSRIVNQSRRKLVRSTEDSMSNRYRNRRRERGMHNVEEMFREHIQLKNV